MSTPQAVHFAIECWGAFFCLIAIVCIFMTKHMDTVGADRLGKVMLCCALLMVSDALAWMFRGRVGAAAFHIVRISNFSAFFFGFLLMPLIALYITRLFEERAGKNRFPLTGVEWLLFAAGVALLIVNARYPFMYSFDDGNRYYRLSFAFLPALIGAVGILITIVVVVSHIKLLYPFEKFVVVLYLVLPVTASVVQILHYGVSFINISVVASSLLLFFSYEFNFMRYNIELEHKLTEERIRLINKQIQPHFIFNCLATIRYLCLKAPGEAVNAINEFAGYMRGMTEFLSERDCILASREFDLVRHYAALEQKRFGDKLTVEYDVADTDFNVPPFAVETIVENAIKHGLLAGEGKKGRITVASRFDAGNHVVEVTDNGAGFDVGAIRGARSSNAIGLKNTQDRLRLMCGGSLTVESAPGTGTKVTITIPEEPK